MGNILEYHCEKEHPVDIQNNSAVDVAWLNEGGQKYPLFIFEIESATTNAIIANPSKIFAESNRQFEKPLFFFHLLLKGGTESGRVSQMERLFGTHNYRIYRFSLSEETNLIIDVLSQHRRLTDSINIMAIITEIVTNWKEVDIEKIIVEVEKLGFEKHSGNLLPSYAFLTRKYEFMKKHFIRKLAEKATSVDDLYDVESYNTYLGSEWGVPIHLGLLAAFDESDSPAKYFEDFKYWQEQSSYIKMIGPRFHLARDYDLFILGMAGSVLGLISVLFYKVANAREYLSKELYNILVGAEGFGLDINLFNALWLLNIAPNTESGKLYYEYARNVINNNEGIPKAIYDFPLTEYIGFIEGDQSLDEYEDYIKIPDWQEFQAKKDLVQLNPEIVFQIGINYLISNEDDWNPIIAKQL